MINPQLKIDFNIRSLLVLIFSALIFIYVDYIKSDGLINRDDTLMVEPLLKVHHLNDYFEAVANNRILDVQPIRDLTFLINFKIFDWFGFSCFHLFNLILFFIAIYLLSRILTLLGFSPHSVMLGTILFSLHPLTVSAVGWVASRKHTLALIFILLAIYDFLKNKNVTWKSSLFFLLSTMSHQIFFLFPVWVWVYAKIKSWKLSRLTFTSMTIFSWAFVGLATYKTFYINVGDVYYTESSNLIDNISRYVLSIGRSFSLITFPFSISAIYSQGSLWNLIGLPLLIFTFYGFYKSQKRQDTFLWVLLAILAHLPTYIAFINDTYLYLGLICFIIAFLYILEAHPPKLSPKILLAVKITIISLLGFKTIDAAPMWKSLDKLWQYSYSNELSPETGMYFGQFIKNEKDQLELLHWSGQNFNFRGNLPMIDFFVTRIYVSSISVAEKIKIFEDCYFDHPLYKAYYGLMLLEGSESQMKQGIEILSPILKHDYKYFYQKSRETVLKALRYVCQNIQGKEVACQQLQVEY